jgi:uncharacterized protein (DUF3820 family)
MEDKKKDTNLKRNKKAGVGKYSYKYVDIAQIHEYLAQNNMSYYQYTERIDNDDYIMTVKIINGEEKPALRGCRVVDATLQGIKNPAQEQGSALTYARRYSLLMAFGLATEDDDANGLTKIENEITTLEEASNYKLVFGKYKGKTLKEIMDTDSSYINWLQEKGDDTVKNCLRIIDGQIKQDIQADINGDDELPF